MASLSIVSLLVNGIDSFQFSFGQKIETEIVVRQFFARFDVSHCDALVGILWIINYSRGERVVKESGIFPT